MAAAGPPEVSVILPTRDRSGSLELAMRSVLEQDYRPLELIVVDDASSDQTIEVVASFRDERVSYVRLDDPVGAPAARNRGITQARAGFIAFQDSDDEWCPGHLGMLVKALDGSGPEVAVAYGAVRRPRSEGGQTIPGPADLVREGDLRSTLTRYNIVNLPSSVVRGDALRECGGFDERLGRYQDWDLFLTLSRRYEFRFVDAQVTRSGEGTSRITDRADAGHEALELILSKHADLFASDPVSLAAHRARLVRASFSAGRLGRALRHAGMAASHPVGLARWLRVRAGGRSPLDRTRATI